METENTYEGKTPEELVAILAKKDADLATAESAKTATVGELTELRKKKQEIESELEEARKPKTQEPDGGKSTEQQFEEFMSRKQQEEAKTNREKAIEDFRTSSQEFSDAADPGGIKFAAYKREMAKFNFNDLSSVDDIKGRLREVHDFMKRSEKPASDSVNLHKGTGRDSSGDAPAEDVNALDAGDKKLIQQLGWTPERYQKYKEKNPEYVATQKNLLSSY